MPNFQERIVIGPTQWTWADYQRQRCPYWIDRSESWAGGKQVIQRPPLIAVFAAPFALSPRHPRWSILFVQGVFTSLSVLCVLLLAAGGRVGRKMPLLAAGWCCYVGYNLWLWG